MGREPPLSKIEQKLKTGRTVFFSLTIFIFLSMAFFVAFAPEKVVHSKALYYSLAFTYLLLGIMLLTVTLTAYRVIKKRANRQQETE